MTTIYAIANQKGGIGKSTTAHTTGAGLANLYHKKVLLIDTDPQENISIATGAKRGHGIPNIYNVIKGEIDITNAIQSITDRLDIIPATLELSKADIEIQGQNKGLILKKAIEPIKNNYDYIIIDTPPALGILTLNALITAHKVIIPAQADVFSLEAITQLFKTIENIKPFNPILEIDGILLTRYSPRAILSQDIKTMIEETAETIKTKVFNTPIREAIAIKEAQATHSDIFTYAPNSKVAEDYKAFLKELIKGN